MMPNAGAVCCIAGVCLVAAFGPNEQPPVSGTPQFQDLASRSAFSYITGNGFRGRKYFPQPMCGGVAVLDYDSDGIVDLYFTNGAEFPALRKSSPRFHHCLLRGRGDGTFEDRTASAKLTGEEMDYSMGVAAGDYDNDGHTDLFVCNAGTNRLYRNRGDGTFEDVTTSSGAGTKPDNTLSVDAAWLDYNKDGLLDLVVSNYTIWSAATDKVCKRGGTEIYCSPRLYTSVPNRLYRNLGGGKFEDVTATAGFAAALGKGMGISIADFNRDGWSDVFIANDTEPNLLYLNNRNGKFNESAVVKGIAYNNDASPVSGMGVDAKDYDGDGLPDVFYNDVMGQTWALFRNLGGDRGFEYVSAPSRVAVLSLPYSGWGAAFIDFNSDGWKDIYSANGDVDDIHADAPQHDTMFENQNGRTFVDVSRRIGKDFLRVGFQRGSAVTDFDNDGFPDLVVTSLGERPRLLRNSGIKGANWLWLELEGTRSNRDAIGAEIKVITASGRTLYNHVTASIGFMSSSDKRVHFGLGADSKVRSIEIRWPSGPVTQLDDVPVNRHTRIKEPPGGAAFQP